MKKKKYQILSPDGFTIEYNPFYTSKKKAQESFNLWKKRYEIQGYYSSVKYGRITLDELENYCHFNII